MIFVTCGTQKFQLNRLLRALDELIVQGKIQEEIVAQIGHSDYHPVHYEWENFIDGKRFETLIQNCSLLITHSGVGTILNAKKYKKPVIVFPRSVKYKEHVDDHQWQIARVFAEKNCVLLCPSADDLAEKIAESRKHVFADLEFGDEALLRMVENYIETGKV